MSFPMTPAQRALMGTLGTDIRAGFSDHGYMLVVIDDTGQVAVQTNIPRPALKLIMAELSTNEPTNPDQVDLP